MHNKILGIIQEIAKTRASSRVIQRACLKAALEHFPKGEWINTKKLCEIFGFKSPDYFTKRLQEFKIRTTQKGRANLYWSNDVKIIYYKYIMCIPLNTFAVYLESRNLVKSSTFYDRFIRTVSGVNIFFKLTTNVFGERSMSVRTVQNYFKFLRMELYIKGNWFSIQKVAKAKSISERQVYEWIYSGKIKKVYRLNDIYFISPEDYTGIISSKSLVEVSNLFDIPVYSLRWAAHEGKIFQSDTRFHRLKMSPDDIVSLQEQIRDGELFSRIESKKIRKKILKEILQNSSFYESEFIRLKNQPLDSLSLEEQKIIIFAAKIRVRGCVEYLVNFFDKNAKSIASNWGRKIKFSSFNELAHIANTGLLCAIDRYASQEKIFAYFHVAMEWEVKKYIFSLWKDRATFKYTGDWETIKKNKARS